MEKPAAQNIQDAFLNSARRERINVVVHLLQGATLSGRIKSFDKFSVLLDVGANVGQMSALMAARVGRRGRVIAFDYRTGHSAETARRVLEPWGVVSWRGRFGPAHLAALRSSGAVIPARP